MWSILVEFADRLITGVDKTKPKRKKRVKQLIEEESDSKSERITESDSTVDDSIRRRRKSTISRLRLSRARKTIVLDLDETLVHSTSEGGRRHDFTVEVMIDKHICLYYVYKRPYCDLFLKKISEWFKVVIFTASMAEYADPVIDWLDKSRTIVSKRYFRESCTLVDNHYLKDLSIVESDLSQVALIDNATISFQLAQGTLPFILDNGIPIDTWIDDSQDEALLDLLPFLDALRFCDDVRSVLSLRS